MRAGLLATGFYLALFGSMAIASAASPSQLVKTYDTDHDGSLNFEEIKPAAEARFSALDTDHDGTLEPKEYAKVHLVKNVDGDSTIDKNEYMAFVKARFDQADHDHDGTITAKELSSKDGQSLLQLLH